MTLQCPGCKADIDDDSFHCDQCGLELMRCGLCGYTGKGKLCPHDRTPLLAAKALAGSASITTGLKPHVGGAAPAPAAAPAATPATPMPAPAPVTAPTAAPAPAAAPVLCLRHAAQGVVLRPAPGDVLGRRFGPHADVLARFSQVSSNHLQLQRDAGGQWLATDMNSFNHTFYNGRQLTPGQAQVLEAGATLSLGDVAFAVSFE